MTTYGDGDGIPELTEAEKILLRAAESDIAAMSECWPSLKMTMLASSVLMTMG